MAKMDRESGVDINIPYEHHLIHAGKMCEVAHYFTNVGVSASAEFVVNITGTASEVHAYLEFAASTGPIIAYLYEEHTQTNAGTGLQTRNLNRQHGVDTATAVWTYTPTAATTGAATITLGAMYLAAAGGSRIGAAHRENEEMVLAVGKKYLLRVENRAAGAANIFMSVEWYES